MNRLLAVLVGATVLGAVACTSDVDQPGAPYAASVERCEPALAEGLDRWAAAGFSGSIAYLVEGATVCAAGYRLADRDAEVPNVSDTVFSIGSVTKAFTAAAALDLVSRGELGLDVTAGELLSELRGPAARVTVRQLLLHTGGLTGSHGQDYSPLDREAAIRALGGLESAFEPGSAFLYSNAGYTLLALLVEEASGTGYREYVTSRLLNVPGGPVAAGFWNGEPAAPGPRAVGYQEDGSPGEGSDFGGPHWAIEGNGGLAMSTAELARWAGELFAGQVLGPPATAMLTSLRFERGDGVAEIPGWVAFGPDRYGEPVYATAGGGGTGHNVTVVVLPESRRVLAISSNTADVSAEELLAAVGPAVVAGAPIPVPRTGGAVDPAAVAAITGTYRLDGGATFGVAAQQDRLAVSATGAEAVAVLFPLPEGYEAQEVAAHEAAVHALLSAPKTAAGQAEREQVVRIVGPIDRVTLAGTIIRDGELRTYVEVGSGGSSRLFWYALDEAGGVDAAELDTAPPTVLLRTAGAAYRPDDPAGRGPAPTVRFEADIMTIESPAGQRTAVRVR
ncbi:serine hydrolase [Nocardia sp. XZ_19_385]|uniref:serine hydrolase domain-containing protein n=1 Tax=Nocardia sp. XZ_19_385 TaxID=2769488 RepID=UPI00188F6E80|nr:serine hydrolase domain-containing protein [Nocardia sp. XZ_19_385]